TAVDVANVEKRADERHHLLHIQSGSRLGHVKGAQRDLLQTSSNILCIVGEENLLRRHRHSKGVGGLARCLQRAPEIYIVKVKAHLASNKGIVERSRQAKGRGNGLQ